MSLSFFITSTASPTQPPTCRKGVFSNLSSRKVRSSIVSTLMEWSRCSALQLKQKTLNALGQKRFMQMKLLAAARAPTRSVLLCFSQITNDIILYLQFRDRPPTHYPAQTYSLIIIISVSSKHNRMKGENYQPADLNSIIKGRQSYTPKSSGERQAEKSQLAHQGSEQDYHSLKSQYTTNYVSVPHPPVKNAKTLRQEVNLVRNEEHPGEFWAYCIVMKESNLGIYTNERLILLDSKAKTLSYYSQIPPLPLTSTAALPTPKQTIHLATVKKFSYMPAKNGIGEVVIGWAQGEGAKQWRLTMSSRRVAKDFGAVIQQVRTNEYLNKRNTDSAKKIESPSENKVNKKETQFISQVKKLDEQSRKKTPSASSSVLKPEQIMIKDNSIRRLSNVSVAPPTPKAEQPIPEPIKQEIPAELKIQQKKQPAFVSPRYETRKISQEVVSKIQPQIAIIPPPPQENVQPQIKIQEIVKKAYMQLADISTIRSPQSETKRFNQLQSILSSRKPIKEKYYRSSINSHNGNRLSEKKAVVQKIDKATADTLVTNPTRNDSRNASPKVTTPKQQSRYEDKYNSFRMSLLQERRQTKQEKKLPKGLPKRQRMLFTQDEGDRDSWLSRWVQAVGKQALGAVYCKFVWECEAKVRKLVGKYENWDLIHKTGSDFQFEEAGIDFSYFILREQQAVYGLIQKEQEFTKKINNWSYLLKFLIQQQKTRFRVPLACIVNFKGLKVLCKASLTGTIHNIIENIAQYVQPLRDVQDKCKISLHRCQLYEVILKDVRFIYFNQLDALPKLSTGQDIGYNYISLFIKEGVIRNQLDLEQIDLHISQKLIHKFLERLNLTHLLSTLQLEELLTTYGINPTFLGRLLNRARESKLMQANEYLSSQLAAIGLAEHVRVGIHRHVLWQRKDGAAQTVINIFKLFLEENLLLLQQIMIKLRAIVRYEGELQYKSLIKPYVVSSALLKLGSRCDFSKRLAMEELQDLGIDIWSIFTFSSDLFNLYFVSYVDGYHYRNFFQSQLLEQQIFKKKAELTQDLNKQKILAEINPQGKEPYSQCQHYCLLPPILKCRLNFYLAHYSPPENHNLGLPFDQEHSELYFTLYQHSSAYMMTHESFAEDLIGIKWLIKRGKNEQAQYKLGQQRLRAWIWGRHHPQVLMEIHDLESLYALKRGSFQIAAESSLTALQLAIHFYSESDRYWQLIWQKAFFAADVHFQSSKFTQIQALYNICETLSQHIRTNEVPPQAINDQFLEVYRKRAIMLLAEGRTDQCIEFLRVSLGKLAAWKIYFGQKRAATMLVKVEAEVFDIYRLLLRNYEIKLLYIDYGFMLQEALVAYFEKDWNPLYLNNPKLRLTETAKQRLSELIKGAWLYINKNIENINTSLRQQGQQEIKQELIYHYLETIRFENRYFYRYTTQELFKYLVELVIQRLKPQGFSKRSSIVSMIVECLSSLSNSDPSHKRCRLYEQGSKENKLLLLESISHLTGYEYCMGVLQQCFDNYSYQF